MKESKGTIFTRDSNLYRVMGREIMYLSLNIW